MTVYVNDGILICSECKREVSKVDMYAGYCGVCLGDLEVKKEEEDEKV